MRLYRCFAEEGILVRVGQAVRRTTIVCLQIRCSAGEGEFAKLSAIKPPTFGSQKLSSGKSLGLGQVSTARPNFFPAGCTLRYSLQGHADSSGLMRVKANPSRIVQGAGEFVCFGVVSPLAPYSA